MLRFTTVRASTVAAAVAATSSLVRLDDKTATSRNAVGSYLVSAVSYTPHPEKAHKGGEDGHFIAPDRVTIGVADGVGGWASRGIDAGIFARRMMTEAEAAVQTQSDLRAVFSTAIAKTREAKVLGSTTVVLARLENDKLHSLNLGDSGLMVVRLTLPAPDNIRHPFTPQTIAFNTPRQDGDVVVTATDGVWDNLFADEIIELLKQARQTHPRDHNAFATAAATSITNAAVKVGLDPHVLSPFAVASREAKRTHDLEGGKLDDTTTIVSVVVVPAPTSRL